ncbi:CHAT domain-containing protein [Okeania sp.]|uniref:CHAT domain-containing protein n=1 Tax=Okeania sp. TaxID=3100323 RepID=UPI002B4AB9EC|nr:CHAT domain-containing protein [Okeania sp.]
MNQLLKIAPLIGVTILVSPLMTFAQIIPASDGTGTVVMPTNQTSNSQTVDIQGGSRSANGANLFHSFEQFNVNTRQTVNFISTPETQNILTGIRGGNISQIDGMIRVSGSNANLFLMNPAGIIFGSNARLDVPGSFFTTTSTAIEMGNSMNGFPSSRFDVFARNNYSELVGSPSGFVFSRTSGTIINQGNLKVRDGQSIGLVGNDVVNLGMLDAPNGNVDIVMAPENGWVEIRQNGNLLNLEVPTQTIVENPDLPTVALPEMLTGETQASATNVQVAENGTIQLTNSNNLQFGRIGYETVKPHHKNDRDRVFFSSPLSGETLSQESTKVIDTSQSVLFQQPFSFKNKKSQNQFQIRTNIPETEFIPPESKHSGHHSERTKKQNEISTLESSSFESETFSSREHNFTVPEKSDKSNVLEIKTFSVEEEIPISETNLDLITNSPVVYSLSSTNTELPTEQILTEASIRETFTEIEKQTKQKPAAIYVITHPNKLTEQIEGIELENFTSGLTLMLVLPDRKPIVKSMPKVEAKKLRRVAKEFYMEVSDPRTTGWPAARQLYQWLITPLETDLKKAGINTLLFYLDEELRSIPLAALYDGEKFLIENYNFSLIPSLSLTNASYQSLENAEVLAMGMSEFVDKPTLPSVPTEVFTITERLWRGEALLNQSFTLENLQKMRNQEKFKIMHIATHANFSAENSPYIQFWDRKLPLKELRNLEWYKQPQVELLVLSACETGLGNIWETEMGFAGLAHQAGVKSALASLWQVSDVGTLRLMIEFYRNLRSSSIKAEALRKAQLALLRGNVAVEKGLLYSTRGDDLVLETLAVRLQTEDLSHPYYWASFTMIGSPW